MAKYVRFPTTLWDSMRSRPVQARAEVFMRYRTPVLHFIQNQGFPEADAEDLAQQVFVEVCKEGFLESADQAKGKFRSLLLAVTRHTISAKRRKEKKKAVSLFSEIEDFVSTEHKDAAKESQELERLWIRNLVSQAMEHLQSETAANGPRYYEALVLNKMKGHSYDEVAERLGATIGDVTNWIHVAKTKVEQQITEMVRSYCSSEEELEEELRLLASSLS